MFWLLILLLICMYLVFYQMGKWKFEELSKKLPIGFPRWPIVGHAYMCAGNDEDIMKCLQKIGTAASERGGAAVFWLGTTCMAVVTDPASSELLLKSCLEKKRDASKILNFLVGNGSIYSPVATWRPRRKMLAPTFNIRKLNHFVDVFANQSMVLVDQLRPAVGKGTFSIWKYLTTYTFDSVCETTLGVRMNAQSNPNQPFLEALESISELITQRLVKPWLQPDWIYRLMPQHRLASECRDQMYKFIDEIIVSKRKQMEEKQRQRDCAPDTESSLGFQSLLEMLLETSLKGKGFSDVELREEALVMSAAGTDTSATGVCFTLVMLARCPEIQEKVVEELNEVLDIGDKCVTAADLPRLKYLDAVVKETLRLYPPVPVITRTATKDVELQSGITLPEDTGIMVNIWAIHRNPRYWGPDANDFRPERFFEPLTHPGQFVPFSYGLRNCLGYQYAMMSMKTVLVTILRQYRVLPPEGMDPKTLKEPIRVKYDIMMKAVDKFQVQLEDRAPRTSREIG